MPVLHNRISNEELKARMLAETEPRTTVSFYKYFSIDDPKAFRDSLYVQFEKLKVFGRIYVAKEGINAQISVPQHNFDAFKAALFASHPALDQVRLNIALEDDGKSFGCCASRCASASWPTASMTRALTQATSASICRPIASIR